MAEIKVEGDEVVLHLSALEKIESVHGELRAPLSTIRSVEILDDAHEPADHGFKVGGRLPGVFEVATVTTSNEKLFAAVHHDTPRGVRINFDKGKYNAWIIGCSDPEAVKAQLESH
jgi:hypothetical protein